MPDFGSENRVLKISDHLKTCPASFSQSTEVSCLLSTLSSFQGVLTFSRCGSQLIELVSRWLASVHGQCQHVADITKWLQFAEFDQDSSTLTNSKGENWFSVCCYFVSIPGGEKKHRDHIDPRGFTFTRKLYMPHGRYSGKNIEGKKWNSFDECSKLPQM